MGVEIAIVNKAIPTGTGDVDFDELGFGQPQIAIFKGVPATAIQDAQVSTHARFFYGAADGSDEFVVSGVSRTGGGTSDTGRYHGTNHCLAFLQYNSAIVEFSASFKQWITDGVRITVDQNNYGSPIYVTAILIKGLSGAKVHTFALDAQDTEVDVNSIGFEPTDLIPCSIGHTSLNSITNHWIMSLGAVHNGGNQHSYCQTEEDASGIMDFRALLDSNYGASRVWIDGTITYQVEFTNFDANGFSAYARNGSGSGYYVSVIALKCPGDSYVGMGTHKTSSGLKSYTGVGFEPLVVKTFTSAMESTDSVLVGVETENQGATVFTPTDQYSCGRGGRTGSTNTYEYIYSSSRALHTYHYQVVGQNKYADLDSMDSDGFTLDFITSYNKAMYFIFFAIGPGEAGPVHTIEDTLELIEDEITYELLRARVATVADVLPIIQDQITFSLSVHIEKTVADVLPVIQDAITYVRQESFEGTISDVLPVIQDAITYGKINIKQFARWVAPLRISPLVADIPEFFLASNPIRHPTYFFQPKVKSYGQFTRAISAPAGFVRSGDVTVKVIDADNSIRQAIGTKTIQDAIAELKLGPENGSYAAFLRPWRRRVQNVTQGPDGELNFKLVDFVFKFLERPIPNVITAENFPNLPENSSEAFGTLVLGAVSSDGGALPCPCVDPTNYYYFVSRHSISVTGVYRKADDSDEFESVPGSEYSIIHPFIEHELGTGDNCTIINFNSDQSGKEIRANADATPAYDLSNFADAIHAMFLYLAWALDYGEVLNTTSFTDTAAKVSSLECAGAWTKSISFGEALTQLQRSSNIHVFADKNDRVTIAYPSDDDEPVMNLSDILRLYKGTVKQSIATPAKNQVPYNYAPNYAAGTWKTGTHDNETDQEKLGRVDPEETLQMYFVRDATTAAAVAARRAEYLDLDSFRIEADVPLVPVLEELELADIVSVDHFGGMKTGGYLGEFFQITEIGTDIDNLKLSFKAIRRRGSPQSFVETYTDDTGTGEIGGGTPDDDGISVTERRGVHTADTGINALNGPWYDGVEGELFGVFRHTGKKRLMLYFTANHGVTWLERDAANSPTLTNDISSFAVCQSGHELRIAVQENSSGRVSYHVFNTVSKTWTTVDDEVVASASPSANAECVSIDSRYPSDEPIIFFQGDRENVGGSYYRRGYYSILSGGSWSSPVQATHSVATNCDIQRVVAGRSDRVHFFYELDPADRWVRWTPDDWIRTMSASLVLGTEQLTGMSSVHYPAERNINNVFLYSNREKILIIRKVGWGKPTIEIYSEDSTISLDRRVTLSGMIQGQGNTYSHNPAGFVGGESDGSVLYASSACWSNPARIVEQRSVDDGASWSAVNYAGPYNSTRYQMEQLTGKFIKVRTKMYMTYFSSETGRSFPVFRWIAVDELPYS